MGFFEISRLFDQTARRRQQVSALRHFGSCSGKLYQIAFVQDRSRGLALIFA